MFLRLTKISELVSLCCGPFANFFSHSLIFKKKFMILFLPKLYYRLVSALVFAARLLTGKWTHNSPVSPSLHHFFILCRKNVKTPWFVFLSFNGLALFHLSSILTLHTSERLLRLGEQNMNFLAAHKLWSKLFKSI